MMKPDQLMQGVLTVIFSFWLTLQEDLLGPKMSLLDLKGRLGYRKYVLCMPLKKLRIYEAVCYILKTLLSIK